MTTEPFDEARMIHPVVFEHISVPGTKDFRPRPEVFDRLEAEDQARAKAAVPKDVPAQVSAEPVTPPANPENPAPVETETSTVPPVSETGQPPALPSIPPSLPGGNGEPA